eukprot:364059-Chlamydomonas_euryale.AAC.2
MEAPRCITTIPAHTTEPRPNRLPRPRETLDAGHRLPEEERQRDPATARVRAARVKRIRERGRGGRARGEAAQRHERRAASGGAACAADVPASRHLRVSTGATSPVALRHARDTRAQRRPRRPQLRMQRLARARAAPCGGRAAPRALPPPPPLVACQSRRLAGRRLPDKRGRGGSPGRPGVITCARGAGNEQEASAPPAAPPAASSSSSPAHVSVDEAGWAEPNGGKPLEGSDAEASLIELEMEEEMVYKYGWLIFWLIATAAFGTGIYFTQGAGKAEEFFAGARARYGVWVGALEKKGGGQLQPWWQCRDADETLHGWMR